MQQWNNLKRFSSNVGPSIRNKVHLILDLAAFHFGLLLLTLVTFHVLIPSMQ
ncbi:hypothetical protein CJ030_MR5G023750 [Morella rubra]|uniref:Transmembrane protein n=1 Tax=Morella rubra TaxID=262757 RepID=A0A6A1VGE1_9ROSI|nr:hypothetical protein CJ030_MR5G023750 [Morella rubra]